MSSVREEKINRPPLSFCGLRSGANFAWLSGNIPPPPFKFTRLKMWRLPPCLNSQAPSPVVGKECRRCRSNGSGDDWSGGKESRDRVCSLRKHVVHACALCMSYVCVCLTGICECVCLVCAHKFLVNARLWWGGFTAKETAGHLAPRWRDPVLDPTGRRWHSDVQDEAQEWTSTGAQKKNKPQRQLVPALAPWKLKCFYSRKGKKCASVRTVLLHWQAPAYPSFCILFLVWKTKLSAELK